MPTPTEHVVAGDPGGRSGWASAKMSTDRFEWTGTGVLRRDLMVDWLARQQKIAFPRNPTPSLEEYEPIPPGRVFDVVVLETWIPRYENGSMEWIRGRRLYEAEDIGAMKWITLKSGAKLIEQHPSDKPQAVATMPEVFAELNRDSNEQHDQDARMHLWLYFWREWFSGTVDPASTVIV